MDKTLPTLGVFSAATALWSRNSCFFNAENQQIHLDKAYWIKGYAYQYMIGKDGRLDPDKVYYSAIVSSIKEAKGLFMNKKGEFLSDQEVLNQKIFKRIVTFLEDENGHLYAIFSTSANRLEIEEFLRAHSKEKAVTIHVKKKQFPHSDLSYIVFTFAEAEGVSCRKVYTYKAYDYMNTYNKPYMLKYSRLK